MKLLDFGLAKSAQLEAGLTQTGVMLGTPHYMAPEYIEGKPVDARTDLYSFAAVVHEALTGRKVHDAAALSQVLVSVLTHDPGPASAGCPGLSSLADALLASALEKDPARRPRDAAVWGAALADALEATPPVPGRPGWPEQPAALARLGAVRDRRLGTKAPPADR